MSRRDSFLFVCNWREQFEQKNNPHMWVIFETIFVSCVFASELSYTCNIECQNILPAGNGNMVANSLLIWYRHRAEN